MTHTCAYREVRNVGFSENFAYVLNEWPLIIINFVLVVAEWDLRNLCHQFKIFMVFSKFPEHFLRNLCHILTIYAIKTDIVQTETTMIWFVNAAFLLIISRTNITSPSPHKLWVWFCSIRFFQRMRVFRKINWEQ